MNRKISIYQSQIQMADELANLICSLAHQSILKNNKFNIALSGGSTPKSLFCALADNYADKLNWSKINFFWGDERSVSPDDEQSNYKTAKKNLLDRINIPSENIFRIKGENNPEEEAERYSSLLKSNLKILNNLPSFDFILLGIGEDGHTASIFPNQMHLLKSDKICEVAIHPETGQKRITLTGKVINNANNICFMVSGENKAIVVSQILKNLEEARNYPANYIISNSGLVQWHLDKRAAKYLH